MVSDLEETSLNGSFCLVRDFLDLKDVSKFFFQWFSMAKDYKINSFVLLFYFYV